MPRSQVYGGALIRRCTYSHAMSAEPPLSHDFKAAALAERARLQAGRAVADEKVLQLRSQLAHAEEQSQL
jgi:hypothetical protein